MTRRVCEILLDVLADAGARDVFGVTGDALNPLLEAIRTDARFRWYGVRHEENAAYAAYAQAELTGGIGVCAGTTGPGAVHLINGLYNAKKEGAGVVAITGQGARAERGSDSHKEIDLAKLFDGVCAFQALVESPAQVPRVVEIAVQRALAGEVVRIEVPIDVMAATVPSEHFRRPLGPRARGDPSTGRGAGPCRGRHRRRRSAVTARCGCSAATAASACRSPTSVSAVRFEWPIKVLVFNNGELGFVKMETEVAGLPANPQATALRNPDFVASARACGGDGMRVEHAGDASRPSRPRVPRARPSSSTRS